MKKLKSNGLQQPKCQRHRSSRSLPKTTYEGGGSRKRKQRPEDKARWKSQHI